MHCKLFDEQATNEIDVPPDLIMSILPGLERLVLENRLHVDDAQNIIQTHKVPLEIGQHLGLIAHSGNNIQDMIQLQGLQGLSQSASPLTMNYGTAAPPVSGNNMYHFTGIQSSNLNSFNQQYQHNATQNCLSMRAGDSVSPVSTSPMHQITRGLSGLSTGNSPSSSGLISRGVFNGELFAINKYFL